MLDPWSYSETGDYSHLMDEFGIEVFDPDILPHSETQPRLFRERIVFGQRGFEHISRRIARSEPFAIMSGLMPSGRMHLGHKMVIDQILYLQGFGARVFVGIADLESYATRNMPLDKAREIAIGSYVRNYLALGIGKEGLEIYFQSRRKEVKDLALLLGKKVNLSTMRAIYGFNDQTNMGHMNAPLLQAGDILHPQIKLGPIPVVVPVGVDQDPHMRLCRDLASSFRTYNGTETSDGRIGVFVKVDEDVSGHLERAKVSLEAEGFLDFKMIPSYKALYVMGASRSDLVTIDEALARVEAEKGGYGFLPPASTYHRFIKGLTGEKMSSSKPETAIFLDDLPDDAASKLMKAITGGRETAEQQRKEGGRPDICSVFDTMMFHTVKEEKEIQRIRSECLSGERLCGQCKREAAEHMRELLTDLKSRRDETEHLLNLYISEE
ncbi:MAG: tryptophan--tRNA ligase [Candidatus Thermoplasmatota archaeon]|nr:tryptophan--tRNA ligase [Candidatus Thermoplasmatota archaeon]